MSYQTKVMIACMIPVVALFLGGLIVAIVAAIKIHRDTL
jgi:hypothetical protein